MIRYCVKVTPPGRPAVALEFVAAKGDALTILDTDGGPSIVFTAPYLARLDALDARVHRDTTTRGSLVELYAMPAIPVEP